MSLVQIHWSAGQTDETKLAIRRDIAAHFGEIAMCPPEFFMVDFVDYPGIDRDPAVNDAFIRVYATEGHSKERKEAMCRTFTEDVCRHTGFDTKRVGFFFFDIAKGNMGSGGRIVNYLGLVADLLREGKIRPEDIM